MNQLKDKFIKVTEIVYAEALLEMNNGLVYYNFSTDMIFVRSVIHDFGAYQFLVQDPIRDEYDFNVVFIGFL